MRLLVNIDVPDLAAATRFYQAALGLKLKRVMDGDVAELGGADSMLYLLQKPEQSAANAAGSSLRQYDRHWTAVHLDFVVDDLDQAAQQAIAAGARQESQCVHWRGSRCITFSDPFGHGFCLIEFERGSYDPDQPQDG